MTNAGHAGNAHVDVSGKLVLVAVDVSTNWIWAWVVPKKREHWYAIEALAGHLGILGITVWY